MVVAHAAEGPASEAVGCAKSALANGEHHVQVVECLSEFKRRCVFACLFVFMCCDCFAVCALTRFAYLRVIYTQGASLSLHSVFLFLAHSCPVWPNVGALTAQKKRQQEQK